MLATLLMLTGCIQAGDMGMFPLDGDGMERLPYLQIDQEQARRMMEYDDGHVIVDVRRQDEYESGSEMPCAWHRGEFCRICWQLKGGVCLESDIWRKGAAAQNMGARP